MSLPFWLKVKAPNMEKLAEINKILRKGALNTICESAICPNLGECFSRKTAAFLIMGNTCTRNCGFCAVSGGQPETLSEGEPARLAEAVRDLDLDYVVITSVTRDDLSDGGAGHFKRCIEAVRAISPAIYIEVLIPDFGGSESSLQTVLDATPDVLNHNMETVERFYSTVRPGASFQRSLDLLENSKRINIHIFTKTGLMLGLGETREEILTAMNALRTVDCDILTMGQYLAPSPQHIPVFRYVPPDEFKEFRRIGLEMGFRHIAAGPLVRSSYRAREALQGRNN